MNNGDGQNEFTFDKATPGVLVVNFKALAVVGDQSLQDVARHVSFEIENIGSSPVWAQSNPGGRASVSNGFLVASATFTGLPASNNDFGKKQILLKVDGSVCRQHYDRSVL